ncbi:MAG: exo-alpha-sialidase [Chloroflexi bacterium]|nr:exo-alpha-sialidase [Chloroflexota bacterium]
MDHVVTSSIIVYKAPHTYCSHPCVTKLANGDWLVAFSQGAPHPPPAIHPPNVPQFINLICRSRDQGRTWEQPRVAPNYDWYGVETPGLAQLSSGDVLLNQWRFLWYPLELAKKLWLNEQRRIFIFESETSRWRPAQTEADWAQHPFSYARADGGAYVHISTDNGYTWQTTVPVDITPYQGAFSPKGAIELSTGQVLLALGSHDYDPLAASFVVHSTDQGRSWQKPVEAARVSGRIFSEPSVVETRTGKLLVMSRDEATGYIHQSESVDGGPTWLPTRQLPLWGYPVHAIRLIDSRLLIIYGRRKAPMSIRAAVSEDEGQSWSDEIVIRDKLPDTDSGLNFGYPSVIEYAPGQLFTAYYAEDDGAICIQGTYFTLQSA